MSTAAEFHYEFLRFLRDRAFLRRAMPTPDCFPLFCALVEAAKKYYAGLPEMQRFSSAYIPFDYFDRHWAIRRNMSASPRPGEAYIDLCDAGSKSVMVTVAVAVDANTQGAAR